MRRHVAVVGAGPAGLAATRAALAAGAAVTVIDSAESAGGQYHRMLPRDYRARRPDRLHHGWRDFERRRRALDHPRCTWSPESDVWALEPSGGEAAPRIHVVTGTADGSGRDRWELEPDALVLATGAHDRVLPFPGWQLPGVYTAGAAQALAKGERVAVGERVVVAGAGPFLLPVAASLLEAGATVREVLEANPLRTVLREWAARPVELGRVAWISPSRAEISVDASQGGGGGHSSAMADDDNAARRRAGSAQQVARSAGLALTSQLGKLGELAGYAAGQLRHRVPYRTGRAVVETRGDGRVEEVVTARLRADWSVVAGSERTLTVDAVCVGHGFTPRLELPLAAGCGLDAAGYVAVDADQRSIAEQVYAAGEITGIAGAPASVAEGTVAGWSAAGGDPAAIEVARGRAAAGRAFAARLARAHPLGRAWPGWLREDTVICRCEETPYGSLCRAATADTAADPRALKLVTRAGLGPCQARICGPTVAELTAGLLAETGTVPPTVHRRPIAAPIRLGELAGPDRSMQHDNPNEERT